MTPFGESYLFFGWTGLIIGMWIIGTTLALLYRFLDRPGAAIVYLALVPTVLELEPELASYLTTIVQRSLVFIVVFFIITHRAKEV
jgi:ABC-type thiamin/hydroxymethylpyrimidine transport system permease subunit